jgi:hypothetical protein
MATRSNVETSLQIGRMGSLNVSEGDFYLEKKSDFFLLKNEGEEPVVLDVILAKNDHVISVMFYPGWNPELVKVVKQTSTDVSNIKWGN